MARQQTNRACFEKFVVKCLSSLPACAQRQGAAGQALAEVQLSQLHWLPLLPPNREGILFLALLCSTQSASRVCLTFYTKEQRVCNSPQQQQLHTFPAWNTWK